MKIREAGPRQDRSEAPVIPQNLFDKGLLSGIEIDPADQIKERQARFTSSTSLSQNVPDTKTTSEEEGWIRQETPSLGVPYGLSHLWVRPITVPILAQVHAAQLRGEQPNQQQAAFTMLVDALAPTIRDFDIRNLTVPDWNSHIYWLRLNSYPKSPFTIPWTSRYGNENVTRVTTSNFKFEELALSREEYLAWNKKGISFPTVRDMEMLLDPSLDEKTRWTITYAQYIYLDEKPHKDTMRKKIALFEEAGPDMVAQINQFAAIASHGVIEQVTLRDEKFELDAAIAFIEQEVANLTQVLEIQLSGEEDDNVGAMISLTNHVTARAEELKMLRAVKERGGLDENGRIFQPEQEVVALASANATMLFP